MARGHDGAGGRDIRGRLPVRTFIGRIALRSLMLLLVLVPFVALIEINRVLGPGTLGRFLRGRV